MKDILEKLTLYDLCGYAFPGSIVVIALIVAYGRLEVLEQYKDLLSYGVLAALLLSYLCGLILSEISAHITERIRDVLWKNEYKEWNIEHASIAAAIAKSKKDGNSVALNNTKSWNHYVNYMYSVIQIAPETKRIHNYASMEIMCRNLSCACVISALLLRSCLGWCMMFVLLAAASLLFVRSDRFGRKKHRYTIYWFLQKIAQQGG